ncbi:hypothetical protein Clacol_004313 [Clathrus columnatus]|uniref:Uncharacterized protein n=1 Tax=Clathrus columnatus TaxID=1419009 RepID=A0AAV5A8S9_9AGAM|nr:hypothetical protein Clacol_004313 [Clathrus columnatus]
MHFLAEGRNDRIQRWIAEQVQSRTSQESDTQGSARDSNDSKPSFEGKKEDGVYWQMEDLEREMALTAYAFGRKNWPISASSIDTSILNLGDLKRLSELIVHEKKEKLVVVPDLQQPDIVEEPPSPTTPERVHDKRRDARIVSQPPEIPPTPQIFDLPSPIIHRAAPVPPPIETTPRTSDVPPIAFIFQETSSPVSSSIHFTPALQESLEAFPSTPRSFTSFIRPSIDGHVKFQELFLSPRLITPRTAGVVKTPNVVSQEPTVVAVSSPMTPYSMYSDSCLSTPSLSAFPPTPASTFPSKLLKLPFMSKRGETETKMPPVPEVPPSVPLDTDPTHANTNKSLPPSPIPSAEIVVSSEGSSNDVQTISISTLPAVAEYIVESPVEHAQDNTEALSDSASDILSGRLSSRFSLFSSKFSISSLDDLDQNETKGKWSSTIGKASSRSRSRAASVSTNHTGGSKKNVFKSKSSSASLHSRAGSRNETRSPAHITQGGKTHSRNTSSRTGSRSGSLAAQDLSSSLSSLGLLSTKNENPMESRMNTHHTHTRADSVPTPLPPPSVPVSVGNGFSPSVSESPSHRTTAGNGKGRNTLMSRISLGMGLRRSRSSGSSGSRSKHNHPRNKTHATTLSGSNVNVSEHVYFNTGDGTSNHTITTATVQPFLNDTRSAVIPSSSSSISSPASMMIHTSAPSYSQTTNPPVPSKPPRLTLTTQFGSAKSTTTATSTNMSMIRYPLTPKTPASSISSSFFTGGGGGESTSAEPLPTINWRECLILRGVNRDNKYDEPVIRWCEQLGEIDDILRIRGSGTIVVYFKEEGIMKKNRGVFDPREVNIAGVGIVTINWSRTMVPPEKKPSV